MSDDVYSNNVLRRQQPREITAELSRSERALRSAREFRRNAGVPALLIMSVMVFSAVFAGLLSPVDPGAVRLETRLTAPFTTWEHVLGTDSIGRDMLARLLYGARISLFIGFSAVVFSTVFGVLLGSLSAFYGGWTDKILMRIGDAQLAVPSLLLALVIMSVLGAGVFNVILALSIGGWVLVARVVRSSMLPLREVEYVLAARVNGCNDIRIMFRHMLPNVVAPIIILMTLAVGSNIITESSLSFLGLGVDPATPSWGAMLSGGREYIVRGWWVALFPGLAITLTVLSVNIIGDGLRDQLDPRLRKR